MNSDIRLPFGEPPSTPVLPPTLVEGALAAVRVGDIESAARILDAHAHGDAMALREVFRLYQIELDTQAQQLRESQTQTEATLHWHSVLMDTLPVACLLLDADGQILEANSAARTLLNLPTDGRFGALPLRRHFPGTDADLRLFRLLHDARTRGQSRIDEQAVIAANGETRWVDLLISTVGQRADLKQVEFSCTLIDMTDRVAAERALMHSANAEHSRELAEGASRAKTELLSRVSHELRTPLNAVLGFAQLLLREESAVRPDRRDFVKHIQTAGQDLLALVDEILEINRAESGHLPLHLSAVSLADAAKRVMVLQQPIAAVHHVQLEWAATPEWPISARADDGRVRQVLTNLIANAIKYNHAGGWVRLATGHDERSTWLEVRDSGRGMRSAQMAHLFEPFNRLGAERESSDGYGLGLSICKTFCDAMGGQLEVESVEDEGSCFRLRLPRWDRPPR